VKSVKINTGLSIKNQQKVTDGEQDDQAGQPESVSDESNLCKGIRFMAKTVQ